MPKNSKYKLWTLGVKAGKLGVVGIRTPERELYDENGEVAGGIQEKDQGDWVVFKGGKRLGKIFVGMSSKNKIGKVVCLYILKKMFEQKMLGMYYIIIFVLL